MGMGIHKAGDNEMAPIADLLGVWMTAPQFLEPPNLLDDPGINVKGASRNGLSTPPGNQ